MTVSVNQYFKIVKKCNKSLLIIIIIIISAVMCARLSNEKTRNLNAK